MECNVHIVTFLLPSVSLMISCDMTALSWIVVNIFFFTVVTRKNYLRTDSVGFAHWISISRNWKSASLFVCSVFTLKHHHYLRKASEDFGSVISSSRFWDHIFYIISAYFQLFKCISIRSLTISWDPLLSISRMYIFYCLSGRKNISSVDWHFPMYRLAPPKMI